MYVKEQGMRKMLLAVCVVVSSVALGAHVTVAPRQSAPRATQKYTVRVPTEGQVSTVAVELEVPPNVTVTDVPAGGDFKVELKRDGNRIVAITWTREIKPRESAAFAFVAVNPAAPGEIAWKAHQRFADGTSADWVGVSGDRRPASVTRIGGSTATSEQHDE